MHDEFGSLGLKYVINCTGLRAKNPSMLKENHNHIYMHCIICGMKVCPLYIYHLPSGLL